MTQRSPGKHASFWDGEVRSLENTVKRFAKLVEDEQGDDELRVSGRRQVLVARVDLVRAQYAAGVAIPKLVKAFAAAVEALAAYRADPGAPRDDADVDPATMLALGVLLGATDAQLAAIGGTLAERLAASPRFAPLAIALAEPDPAAASAQVLAFVRGDAARLAATPGAWAFEAAAVVVARQLDDTTLRGVAHYPAELALHARTHARAVR
jgi:PoNe immunity proteins (PoNi), C-terminal